MTSETLAGAERKMLRAVEAMERDFATLRTGRASTALVPCVFYREQLKDTITAVPPFKRLKLDAARCRQLMADSAQQIRALQTSLSA